MLPIHQAPMQARPFPPQAWPDLAREEADGGPVGVVFQISRKNDGLLVGGGGRGAAGNRIRINRNPGARRDGARVSGVLRGRNQNRIKARQPSLLDPAGGFGEDAVGKAGYAFRPRAPMENALDIVEIEGRGRADRADLLQVRSAPQVLDHTDIVLPA